MFASPAADQIASVVRATNPDAGVILMYGNYAGDVLNFEAAAQLLRSEGIDVATLAISDDVASAPRSEWQTRRGIAGDLVVIKSAAAAAERGEPLSEVHRVAQPANDSTVSIGVAFSGCTLPGATEQLFEVASGQMALGMGVHGEPGLGEVEGWPSARLSRWLVSGLLEEFPSGGPKRVTAILNGLGATKHEELFVLWSDVAQDLLRKEITIVNPLVGEYMTSLDMAGVSLTLALLNDELESMWNSPCHAPALYRDASLAGAPSLLTPKQSVNNVEEPNEQPNGCQAPRARFVVGDPLQP